MNEATKEGTENHAKKVEWQRYPSSAFRRLGRTQLTSSALGFGCYRVDDEVPLHLTALEKALEAGCNLIDTSANYTDGGSERCVGTALAELIDQGDLKRSEVIVVSKVGYIQGQNLDLAKQRESSGHPFPDVVKYTDSCWHCISPEFISDQLSRSLARLQLAKIDVYLLHNPEYFFSDAIHRNGKAPVAEMRAEFYDRIRRAFSALEDEVDKGRIQWYGVSSNTFGNPTEDREMTSVSEMWRIAREIGLERRGDKTKHHFAVIQLPLNLFESGPALEINNGFQTVLQFAGEHDLGVLVNRPLNAYMSQQLVRLVDYKDVPSESTLDNNLKLVLSLEEQFLQEVAPVLKTPEGAPPASEFFRWGRELARPELMSVSMERWGQIQTQIIEPQMHYLLSELDDHFSKHSISGWDEWKNKYVNALNQLMGNFEALAVKRSQAMSEKISQKLDPFLPEELRPESLSRKVLATLIYTPGVSCVLNGMRQPKYVDDSMGAMKFPRFAVDEKLYQAFRMDN